MKHSDLTSKIIANALEVHSVLGPGLLEKIYEGCLQHELNEAGILVDRQLEMPVKYKNLQFAEGYRIDLLVAKTVVVEVKAVETLTEVHFAQILSYMRLGGFPVGLLINFNVKSLKDGIRRFVL
jgi:GxxExxY protein